jgi:hypothetical protein
MRGVRECSFADCDLLILLIVILLILLIAILLMLMVAILLIATF